MLKLTSEMLISVDLCHSCYMSAVFPQRKAAEGFISLLGVLLFELRQATALRCYPKRGCKWLFRGNVHKGVWSTQLRGLCGHTTGTRRGLAPVHLAAWQCCRKGCRVPQGSCLLAAGIAGRLSAQFCLNLCLPLSFARGGYKNRFLLSGRKVGDSNSLYQKLFLGALWACCTWKENDSSPAPFPFLHSWPRGGEQLCRPSVLPPGGCVPLPPAPAPCSLSHCISSLV